MTRHHLLAAPYRACIRSTHRDPYRQSEYQRGVPRQTSNLRQFLPSRRRRNVGYLTLLRRAFDGILTVINPARCQKSNAVNVLDYALTLVIRVPRRDSILSSRESIVADFSVASASLEDNFLLSSIRIRYSRIRFATISISASLNGFVR